MEELALPPGRPLTLVLLSLHERTEKKSEEGMEGRKGERKRKKKKKKGSMHPVDTRLSGEFELKKDVEPGGDSYLAHILKLETFTNPSSLPCG